MEKYSANYAYTNNNFVIQNISSIVNNDKYFKAICILKNILMRGQPTVMSEYLTSNIGQIDLDNDKEILPLIDNEVPLWYSTIKGDEKHNYFPAKTFFEKDILDDLGDASYIQQLIIPEVKFFEITMERNNKFVNQQVDFYLPQARLVIEIDGQQHKMDEVNRISDKERDIYLKKFGVETVRIDTKDLKNKNSNYKEKILEIKARIKEYNDKLKAYSKFYNRSIPNDKDNLNLKKLTATAVCRMQVLVLLLIERGYLSLEDDLWNLDILQRDIDGFEMVAIEDLFIWFKNLMQLLKIPFKKPKVNIRIFKKWNDFYSSENSLKIDFSIMKRYTDEDSLHANVILLRTDYYDDRNYFEMSTTDPINYQIINDGDESDVVPLKFFLKNIFVYDAFVEGQLPIIANALRGNDTIGLLPTGGGKSLCYQFVALLQPCISFVVAPIKSLMYDQKENLDKRYISNTNYISSDQTGIQKEMICFEFAGGKYHFIWISPERFQTQAFREYLTELNREKTIALAVIDEVHCMSEWGHDFRTSYLNLNRTIIKYCPSIKFLGLTATASVNVLEDLKVEFQIDGSNVITLLTYTRPELSFIVKNEEEDNRESKKSHLFTLVKKLNSQRDVLQVDGNNTKAGIIFTLFKNGNNGCYKLANELSAKFNVKVNWYSGEVPEENVYENGKFIKKIPVINKSDFDTYKQSVQKDFKDNKFPLLVATKAFGMGIDKSNVRYTVHFGIPASVEALYQEGGRAGRDKNPAASYVLYSKEVKDKEYIDKLFDLETSIEEIQQMAKEFDFYAQRDIMSNFFLWLLNVKGVSYEYSLTTKLFFNYAKPSEIKLIRCNELKNSFGDVQKAIYRLSLIGIVDDWIIEDWNKEKGIFKVTFCEYNGESVSNHLFKYIRKYDSEFNLQNNSGLKYKKYNDTYNDDSLDIYQKAIMILLEWSYDNVVYHRRQAIKNVVDLCDKYTNPEDFKNNLEGYFKITESTSVFEYISQNPNDYEKWFSIFYDKIGRINKESVNNLNNSLIRFLESYRYNTGLNYISGLIRLILDEFNNSDGKGRFEAALQQINTYDDFDKEIILDKTLEIATMMNNNNKYYLSEILCNSYSENVFKIYQSLKDNNSLSLVIDGMNEKLHMIGDKLI